MALSMDEQRILAEIEQQLTRNDPSLATRLSTFGRRRRRPTPRGSGNRRHQVLRTTALVVICVFILGVVVAAYAAVVTSPAKSPQPARSGKATTSAPAGTQPNTDRPEVPLAPAK